MKIHRVVIVIRCERGEWGRGLTSLLSVVLSYCLGETLHGDAVKLMKVSEGLVFIFHFTTSNIYICILDTVYNYIYMITWYIMCKFSWKENQFTVSVNLIG